MEKYTDGLLDEKFLTIAEKMDDHFDALTVILGDIKKQTTVTNGRVGSLEGWKNRLIGGWFVFSIICLPALGFLCWKVIELDKQISTIQTVIDL